MARRVGETGGDMDGCICIRSWCESVWGVGFCAHEWWKDATVKPYLHFFALHDLCGQCAVMFSIFACAVNERLPAAFYG